MPLNPATVTSVLSLNPCFNGPNFLASDQNVLKEDIAPGL